MDAWFNANDAVDTKCHRKLLRRTAVRVRCHVARVAVAVAASAWRDAPFVI
jgi:hypothetical protein